ncbi:geranylgeranyl pyrophosphate synthetase [Sporothrix epigloea]|uniref:Geranylgeranyl pyrophosphate synthetase n=1 Tax=Sporothrix epigloea TaxID=1892477 RepID=A0ABP0D3X4_9PEZI
MLTAPSLSSVASSSTPPLFLQSPNSIPPRRSSTGQQQHHQQQAASLHFRQQPSQKASPSSAAPFSRLHHNRSSRSPSSTSPTGISKSASSALPSVSERDWLRGSAFGRLGESSSNMAEAQTTSATTRKPNPSSSSNIPSSSSPKSTRTLPVRPSQTSESLPSISSSNNTSSAVTSSKPQPLPDPARYGTDDFNFSARRTWTDEKERIVCGPFEYLNGTRGKEFRTQLINAFNGWLEVPAESLEVITRVVGMLHTASLLVDDVEDSSSLRRGLPVAHNIFGVPQTINSANYIYFLALQELQKLRNPEAIAIFSEELCNLHRGQGMDLFWRDTLTCPTEDDYLEMVGHKTGGLFRLGIKLMQAESSSPVDCVPLVNLLGLLFQIQDDYRNLMASEYSHNKGMCEDLTEGKFSFPVIHSIRTKPSNLQLLNILKQRTADEEVKRYAVAHMESTGSFEYTRRVILVLAERARNLADALDEGKGRSRAVHAILDRLAI